jgi:glutamate decarboxylase
MNNLTNTSDWLAGEIASIEDADGKVKFELLGDNLGGRGLPLVAWRLKEKGAYDGKLKFRFLFALYWRLKCGLEFDVARLLRSRGWIGKFYLFFSTERHCDAWC